MLWSRFLDYKSEVFASACAFGVYLKCGFTCRVTVFLKKVIAWMGG